MVVTQVLFHPASGRVRAFATERTSGEIRHLAMFSFLGWHMGTYQFRLLDDRINEITDAWLKVAISLG